MDKSLTPRLDLDEQIVQQALKATAIRLNTDPQNIKFAQIVEQALTYLPQIKENLEKAGYRKTNVKRGRPRRIPKEFWEDLDKIPPKYDTSKVAFIRAALQLLGKETIMKCKTCGTEFLGPIPPKCPNCNTPTQNNTEN